ncbi:MAG: hypothetical protein WC405_13445 [Syntrophales bacterium]
MTIFWMTLLACFLMGASVLAAEPLTFDNYLKSFDYRERSNMKIGIPEMLNLYKQGQVQIIDIRFPEEYQVYRFGFIKNIPLSELPDRLNELDKSKIIVNVCHIPTIGGVVTRDLVHVVKNPKTGMFGPKADPFDNTYSTKPTYLFFNGMATQDIQPIGSINDPKSKITAFKPLTTIAPRDAKTKKLLFQNLAVLFKTGSVDQALAQGFKQHKQEYSGTWEPTSLTGYFILSHDITKSKALTCTDCHSANNYLGFSKLGYSPERNKQLTNQSDPRYR